MAQRFNIMDKIINEDPVAYDFLDRLFKMVKEGRVEGVEIDDFVITTDDMTREEKEMVWTEFYMKRGFDYKKAQEMAKAKVDIITEIEKNSRSGEIISLFH